MCLLSRRGSEARRRARGAVHACHAALFVLALVAAAEGAAAAPASSASRAVVSEPLARRIDGGTRILVDLDREVSVVELPGEGRMIYRLRGAWTPLARTTVVPSGVGGPVARVEMIQRGDDVDLVVELRRASALRRALIERGGRVVLQIDVTDPAAASASEGPAPPVSATKSAPPKPVAPSAAAPRDAAPERDAATRATARAARSSSSARRAPAPSEARPATRRSRDEGDRTLGGHTFLAPARFESPFVTSHLGVGLAARYGSFDYDEPVVVGRYLLRAGGISQTFDAGVRLHARLGIVGFVGGAIASGADKDGFFKLGLEAAAHWGVGLAWMVARFSGADAQIGARLTVQGAYGGRLDSPERLTDDFLDARLLPTNYDLFGKRSSVSVRFAWSAAHALSRHFGVQGGVGWVTTFTPYYHVGIEQRTARSLDVTLGAAITADAAPWVPAALQVEIDWSGPMARSVALQDSPASLFTDAGTALFGLGAYYTGRRDLMLGVLAGSQLHFDGEARRVLSLRADLKYFF